MTDQTFPPLRRIRRILFAGHDNEGSKRIFEGVRSAFPDVACAVILNEGLFYRRSFAGSVWKLLREASWIFCAARALDMYGYKLRGRTLARMLRSANIPFMRTPDVNGPKATDFARRFQPDLLVSLYTMHIFRAPILSVPRIAAINSHPAILPDYRGLEVFFWAMANGDEQVGSCVFFLTEKVDDGLVIREETLPIAEKDSMHEVYRAISESAARLFVSAIRDIDAEAVEGRRPEGEGRYYPMPTPEAYRRFRRQGRTFW